MAQTSWPFENIDTTETQFSQWARNINEGIKQGNGDELEVTAPGGGMTIEVGTGQAMIRGHYYSNSATETFTIAAADPADDRIDSVVLELDPTANKVELKVLAGTPAGSPVAPTLTQTDSGIYQIRIADVLVEAATLDIVSGDLTDLRTYMFAGIGKWTTATRPTNPVQYQTTGYNTDLNTHEFWNGSSWVGFADPITTRGDLIVGGVSGAPTRLAIGANNKILKSNGTDVVWGDAAGGGYYFEILSNGTKSINVPAGYYAWGVTNASFDFNNTLGTGWTSGFTTPRLDNMTQLTSVTVNNIVNWWTSTTTTGVNLTVAGFIYGASKYVIIPSSSTTLVTSTDAITWTSASFPASGANSIAHSGSMFVASMTQSYIAYSTDGVTWSTSAIGGFNYGVSFGNGFFFAGGQNKVIYYSSNGITWTSATIPNATDFPTWQRAIFGGGRYLFVGSDGYYAWTTSTAFNTWTTGKFTSNTWRVGTFGNNTFYIAGDTGGVPAIASSTDGTTWTTRTATLPNTVNTILYDGTRWLIGSVNRLLLSTDGITWTTTASSGNFILANQGQTVSALLFRDSTYFAAGSVRVSRATNATIEGTPNPARLVFFSAGSPIQIS